MGHLRLEVRQVFKPYLHRSQRFGIMVAHRRCGKTVACVQDLILQAAKFKPSTNWAPGRYAYVAPLLSQGKEIAWDYLRRFSAPIRRGEPNIAELWVELHNGSRIRIHGADNPDRLRGGYLDGCILDEYADMRPSVLGSVIRPMLADRKGWLTAIGTPKGRNDFFQLWDRAQTDAGWFTAMLKASETGLLAQDELTAARGDMTPEEYAQEFECSFDAAIRGAYYSKEIAELERVGHICDVPRAPDVQVQTAWDLGISSNGLMAIWVFQVVGHEIRVLDQYSDEGHGLEHYCNWLSDRGYTDCVDWVPHDARVRELGTGKSRVETLVGFGRKPELVPNIGVEDGINAARLMLPHCWFNKSTTVLGVEALRQYRTDYDERKKTFSDTPRRDWTTDIADAFRYLSVASRSLRKAAAKPDEKPIGEPLHRLTYDQFFDLNDKPAARERL